MKVILQIDVNSCDECPYNDWQSCAHKDVLLDRYPHINNSDFPIPKWCPLPDKESLNANKENISNHEM